MAAALEKKLQITIKLKLDDADVSNYKAWRKQSEAVLRAYGYLNWIEGDTEPVIAEDDQKANNITKRDNAFAVLLCSIDESCSFVVDDCNTPWSFWQAVRAEFMDITAEAASYMDTSFRTNKKKPSQSMKDYLQDQKSRADKLRAAGLTISDFDFAVVVLKLLPKEYKSAKRLILSKYESNEMTFQKLRKELLQEELRIVEEDEDKEEAVLAATIQPSASRPFSLPSQPTNMQHRKPFFCRRHGPNNSHNTPDCFSLQREKVQSDRVNMLEDKEDDEFLLMADSQGHTPMEDATLILDSGATTTCMRNKEMFISLKDDDTRITLPNGNRIKAAGKGTVTFMYHDKSFSLKDALYVPELDNNLISLRQLSEFSTIVFKDGECLLNGKKTKKIGKLYCITVQNHANDDSINLVSHFELHRAMAHPSTEALRVTAELLGWKTQLNNQLQCEGCVKGKTPRKHFASVIHQTEHPGQLIWMDILGMGTPSETGLKYLLVCVDDYSSMIFTFPLMRKSDALEKIKGFLAFVKTHTGVAVKRIRSDGGGEFTSKEAKEFFIDSGIKLEITTPYTPQSNGKAERANRLLLDRIRSCLYDSTVGDDLTKAQKVKLWPYAAMFVQDSLNITARINKQDKTPFVPAKRFYSTLKVQNMRSLAFLQRIVFSALPIPKGKLKLEERVHDGYFLCYEAESTSVAKVLCRSNGKFSIKRTRDWRKYTPNSSVISNLDWVSSSSSEDKQDTEVNGNEVDTHDNDDNDENPEIHQDESDTTQEDKNDSKVEEDNSKVEGTTSYTSWLPSGLDFLSTAPRRSARANKGVPALRFEDEFVGIAKGDTPSNVSEALCSEEWKRSMNSEYESLTELGCWTEEHLLDQPPTSSNTIATKWVFKRKDDGRAKSRIVVQGHRQPDSTYEKTFSPAVNFSTHMILCVIASTLQLSLRFFDVKNAYVNAPLEETIYLKGPQGTPVEGLILRLLKSLYGLKQSGRNWHKMLSSFLNDKCKLMSNRGKTFFWNNELTLFIAIYVDDIEAAGSDLQLDWLQNMLRERFKITVYMPQQDQHLFLGMIVKQEEDGIHLSYSSKIQDLLKDSTLMRSCTLPYAGGSGPYVPSQEEFTAEDLSNYKGVLGYLLFVQKLRPDIVYIVNKLIQYPSKAALKVLMRYLIGTVNLEMVLGWRTEKDWSIKLYADASYADNNDGKSTVGWAVLLNELMIVARTKKPSITGRSTFEAELIAMDLGYDDALAVRNLITEVFRRKPKIHIYTDNRALYMVMNDSASMGSSRTKHINTRFWRIKDDVESEEAVVHWIQSENQLADALTKKVNAETLRSFTTILGLQGSVEYSPEKSPEKSSVQE